MDAKFTKGPWRVERDGNKQEWLVNGGRCEALGYTAWHGLAVVMGSDDDKANGVIAAEANARLIAAAPDLYFALENAVRLYVENGLLANDVSCGVWISEARAAIAKATGADQ